MRAFPVRARLDKTKPINFPMMRFNDARRYARACLAHKRQMRGIRPLLHLMAASGKSGIQLLHELRERIRGLFRSDPENAGSRPTADPLQVQSEDAGLYSRSGLLRAFPEFIIDRSQEGQGQMYILREDPPAADAIQRAVAEPVQLPAQFERRPQRKKESLRLKLERCHVCAI